MDLQELQQKLAGNYWEDTNDLPDLRPDYPGESLLLIGPTPEEVKFFQQRNWKVQPVVFAPGMQRLFTQNGLEYHRIEKGKIWKGLPKCNKAFLSSLSEAWQWEKEFWLSLQSALEKGHLWLKVSNSKYFQNLVDRYTRETLPWTGSSLQSPGVQLEEVLAFWKSLGWRVEQIQVEEDAKCNEPAFGQWKTVNAEGLTVHLPEHLPEKKKSFEKSYFIEMRIGNYG